MPEAVLLLKLVTKVVMDLPNMISIRGHTDARKYGQGATYTNWELSADRSNTSRRVMLGAGLDLSRIENVVGKADREHLIKKDPFSARNRRISIILLKESLVPGLSQKQAPASTTDKKKDDTKGTEPTKTPPVYNEAPVIQKQKQEDGIIYFP